MKFHSDDIRKYQSKLENFLTEDKSSTITQTAQANIDIENSLKNMKLLVSSGDFGNPESIDREELDKILTSLVRSSNSSTISAKLASIFKNLQSFIVDESTVNTSISESINRIILIEYIIKIINSFESTVTGILFEELIAGFLGGKRVGQSGGIVDIETRTEHVSLKFRSTQSKGAISDIDGSLLHLITDVMDGKKIKYITIINQATRDGSRKKAYSGKIYLYEFEVNYNNLLNFIDNLSPATNTWATYFTQPRVARQAIINKDIKYLNNSNVIKKKDFNMTSTGVSNFLKSSTKFTVNENLLTENMRLFGNSVGGPYEFNSSIFRDKLNTFFEVVGKNIKNTYDSLGNFTTVLSDYISQNSKVKVGKTKTTPKNVKDSAQTLQVSANDLVENK